MSDYHQTAWASQVALASIRVAVAVVGAAAVRVALAALRVAVRAALLVRVFRARGQSLAGQSVRVVLALHRRPRHRLRR